MSNVYFGIDLCLQELPSPMRTPRWGLLMNQASVDLDLNYSCDALNAKYPGRIRKLFSPQHGLWGEQQANMIETEHGHYAPLDVPLWSLYADQRRPTKEMLADLDCFIIDLQDVGTRVYTFIWTMLECLKACAEVNLPIVILERPNPLGGVSVEGPLVERGFESFVGNHSIPMRHGLTMGELAHLFNEELHLQADLHVVTMRNWSREFLWDQVKRPWLPPSPNMPRPETAYCYPGQVMLEGTNLSEGRGTTWPFEVCGAPFLDPHRLHHALLKNNFFSIRTRPVRFVPVFDKYRGVSCGGVAIHVASPDRCEVFLFTVALFHACKALAAESFQWLPPPYEYETIKPPIDILFGSAELRHLLESATFPSLRAMYDLCHVDELEWWDRVRKVTLY